MPISIYTPTAFIHSQSRHYRLPSAGYYRLDMKDAVITLLLKDGDSELRKVSYRNYGAVYAKVCIET
jgi:hypothetical protein